MCLQKSPPSLQIFQNLPLESYLSYLHVLVEIPTPFANFLKSATGQLPKLPRCAYRITPPSLQIFKKSATGQLPMLPTCACRNSPPLGLQIFSNLPLDICWCVLYSVVIVETIFRIVKQVSRTAQTQTRKSESDFKRFIRVM